MRLLLLLLLLWLVDLLAGDGVDDDVEDGIAVLRTVTDADDGDAAGDVMSERC